MPDFYQGTELWDLQLVDPDNRRPVDFVIRQEILQEIMRDNSKLQDLLSELLNSREDGRIKLYLIYRGLQARQSLREVFQRGSYLPLRTGGKWGNHLIAFARRYRKSWAITVAPRFLTRLAKPNEIPIGEGVWRDTYLLCLKAMPQSWLNLMTGETIHGSAKLLAGEVLGSFPAALLVDSNSQAERPSSSAERAILEMASTSSVQVE